MIRLEVKDKNGVVLKAGHIVKIEGGYFKADNGVFRVAHAPNDPNWGGGDCSLRKVYKKGWADSSCRGAVSFFPLMVTVSGDEMRRLAREHNRTHATIEVIGSVPMYKVVTQDRYRETLTEERYMTGEELRLVPKNLLISSEVLA